MDVHSVVVFIQELVEMLRGIKEIFNVFFLVPVANWEAHHGVDANLFVLLLKDVPVTTS